MAIPPVSEIEEGDSILFLGAGFSRLATNLNDKNILSAFDLIAALLNECGIHDHTDYDLDTASQEYIEHFVDEERLISFIHNNFNSKDVSNIQKLVVCQPWYRIYTTNYDDVVERALFETKKRFTSKNITDPVERPQAGITQLIHIYGSVLNLSPLAFRDLFLLTERQRDTSPFINSPWYRQFSDDVLAAKHLVFAGFSLKDIDLRRLLGRLPDVTRKTVFIEDPTAPRSTQTRLSHFGKVELIGIQGLAAHFGAERPGVPVPTSTTVPDHIDELTFNKQISTRISGPDIQYLLATGILDHLKLAQSDIDGVGGAYTFKRADHQYTRCLQITGVNRPVLVHSDIGNGKTVFLSQIAYSYASSGFRVFQMRRENDNIGPNNFFFSDL